MKTVVFYYTQSGQALSAARQVCNPLEAGGTVVYKQIVPLQTYPFPWSLDEFFGVFPETRLGQPPSGILPIDFTDVEDADLVIVVGQSWFLSPSLPLQSFFTDRAVMNYLSDERFTDPALYINSFFFNSKGRKAFTKQFVEDLKAQSIL